MRSRVFPFGQEPAPSRLLGPRGTLPMEAPEAPLSSTRITDPLESPASGVRACVTEPDVASSRGPTLPFIAPDPELQAPWDSGSQPPDMPPEPKAPAMSAEQARGILVHTFALGLAASALFLIVALGLVLALWFTPPSDPFVAPPLTVARVVEASSNMPAPESSAAPAVTSSTAASAVAPLPPLRATVKASASPAVKARPRAPVSQSEVIDPWGARR